jgi:cellulose synthase (UDP-forming)
VRIASGAQAILHPIAALEREPALQRAREREVERAIGGLPGGPPGGVAVQVADQPLAADVTTHTAVVEDIGFGGCRLTLRHRLQPGSLVVVEIPGHLTLPEVAEVRWVKRRGLRYEAGLQFDRSVSPAQG